MYYFNNEINYSLRELLLEKILLNDIISGSTGKFLSIKDIINDLLSDLSKVKEWNVLKKEKVNLVLNNLNVQEVLKLPLAGLKPIKPPKKIQTASLDQSGHWVGGAFNVIDDILEYIKDKDSISDPDSLPEDIVLKLKLFFDNLLSALMIIMRKNISPKDMNLLSILGYMFCQKLENSEVINFSDLIKILNLLKETENEIVIELNLLKIFMLNFVPTLVPKDEDKFNKLDKIIGSQGVLKLHRKIQKFKSYLKKYLIDDEIVKKSDVDELLSDIKNENSKYENLKNKYIYFIEKSFEASNSYFKTNRRIIPEEFIGDFKLYTKYLDKIIIKNNNFLTIYKQDFNKKFDDLDIGNLESFAISYTKKGIKHDKYSANYPYLEYPAKQYLHSHLVKNKIEAEDKLNEKKKEFKKKLTSLTNDLNLMFKELPYKMNLIHFELNLLFTKKLDFKRDKEIIRKINLLNDVNLTYPILDLVKLNSIKYEFVDINHVLDKCSKNLISKLLFFPYTTKEDIVTWYTPFALKPKFEISEFNKHTNFRVEEKIKHGYISDYLLDEFKNEEPKFLKDYIQSDLTPQQKIEKMITANNELLDKSTDFLGNKRKIDSLLLHDNFFVGNKDGIEIICIVEKSCKNVYILIKKVENLEKVIFNLFHNPVFEVNFFKTKDFTNEGKPLYSRIRQRYQYIRENLKHELKDLFQILERIKTCDPSIDSFIVDETSLRDKINKLELEKQKGSIKSLDEQIKCCNYLLENKDNKEKVVSYLRTRFNKIKNDISKLDEHPYYEYRIEDIQTPEYNIPKEIKELDNIPDELKLVLTPI